MPLFRNLDPRRDSDPHTDTSSSSDDEAVRFVAARARSDSSASTSSISSEDFRARPRTRLGGFLYSVRQAVTIPRAAGLVRTVERSVERLLHRLFTSRRGEYNFDPEGHANERRDAINQLLTDLVRKEEPTCSLYEESIASACAEAKVALGGVTLPFPLDDDFIKQALLELQRNPPTTLSNPRDLEDPLTKCMIHLGVRKAVSAGVEAAANDPKNGIKGVEAQMVATLTQAHSTHILFAAAANTGDKGREVEKIVTLITEKMKTMTNSTQARDEAKEAAKIILQQNFPGIPGKDEEEVLKEFGEDLLRAAFELEDEETMRNNGELPFIPKDRYDERFDRGPLKDFMAKAQAVAKKTN